MTDPRPAIGLNADGFRDAGGEIRGLRPAYFRAIERAGGLPVVLPPAEDPAIAREWVERFDGFLLTGGDDLPCSLSGGPPLPTAVEVPADRLRSDRALLDALLEADKPTLAVCLGFQHLNVRLGGSLHLDLLFDGPPSTVRHYSKGGDPPEHDVVLAPACRLAKALFPDGEPSPAAGADSPLAIRVNSKHHQAVARLGEGLVATATAPDGIVEAAELPDRDFFLGVQWHPEAMDDCPLQRALLRTLVEKARARRRARP